MNSIKSFSVLTLLAIVGLFLYWKINEKEIDPPPEAADMAFDVPEIELNSEPPFGEVPAYQGNGGMATMGTTAPSFDPATAGSAAPAWAPPPVSASAGHQPQNGTPDASNPFALHSMAANETGPSSPIKPPSGVTPNTAAVPPPGSVPNGMSAGVPISLPNNNEPVVMQGRVYDDRPATLLETAPVAPATPTAETPHAVAALPPGPPAVETHSVATATSITPSPPITPSPSMVPPPPITPSPSMAPPPVAQGNRDIASIVGPASVAAVNPSLNAETNPPAVQPVTPLIIARQTVDTLLAQGNYAQALRLLTNYYGDPALSPAEQQEVTSLISQLAGTVIYSPQHQLEASYIVQPGETLDAIAAKYDVPSALLAKINGLPSSDHLTPGMELKVVRGPFSAIVDLTRRELTLMLNGSYAGRFDIGIGIDQPNMAGTWNVVAKKANPTYQAGNQQIAGGDPVNPLGDRMLVLQSPSGSIAPIGIHGSPAASVSGTGPDHDDPRGFIRLSSADAADVYDILSVGSHITVRK